MKCRKNFRRGNRKLLNPYTDSVKESIGNGSRRGNNGWFTGTFRSDTRSYRIDLIDCDRLDFRNVQGCGGFVIYQIGICHLAGFSDAA